MLFKLFLLFTVVPLLELWLLLKVGAAIGAFETIFLVIATGAIGAFLARQQGFQVYLDFQKNIESGKAPSDPIVEGLLLFVGGALLVTPGIVTDIFGFSLVVPVTRRFIRDQLKKYFLDNLRVTTINSGFDGFRYQTRRDDNSAPKVKWRNPSDNDDNDDVIDV